MSFIRTLYIVARETQLHLQRTRVFVERMTHWNSLIFSHAVKKVSIAQNERPSDKTENREYEIMMRDMEGRIDIRAQILDSF